MSIAWQATQPVCPGLLPLRAEEPQGATQGVPQEEASANEPIFLYHLESVKEVDRANLASVRASWDQTHLISSLQGLVNRTSPRLYLFFVQNGRLNIDQFWLDLFSKENPVTGEKGWLQDRPRQEIHDLEELLTLFRQDYDGVVVYDEQVPATSNLASSIAGADRLLCLRYDSSPDSLYFRLVEDPNGLRLPVRVWLLNQDKTPMFTGKGTIPGTALASTGSAKADAYYWLIEKYIKTGKCQTTHAGYYIDAWWIPHGVGAVQNHLLTNHDYFISKGGFFFDLSPWDDETPNDDPHQKLGTDYRAFCDLLRAAYEQNQGKTMIHIGGFTPWDTKYTNHPQVYSSPGMPRGRHDGVPTEWRHAEILSAFNAYMDADALGYCAMANASFFTHFPLQEVYPFAKPTQEDLHAKGYIDDNGHIVEKNYVTNYVGDYDSAAWVYQMLPRFWFDSERGTIPLGWAFNPNLADRFAPGFDYFRKTATDQDTFVAGDSGAGYVNPMALAEPRKDSQLPSGVDVWVEHCQRYYRQWDLTITGFIIDGFAPLIDEAMREQYRTFSPDGLVLHQQVNQSGMTQDTPWIGMNYDLANPDFGVQKILEDTRLDAGTQFHIYRSILWAPSQYQQMFDAVLNDPEKGAFIEIVDPYTFFLLLKLHLKEQENQ